MIETNMSPVQDDTAAGVKLAGLNLQLFNEGGTGDGTTDEGTTEAGAASGTDGGTASSPDDNPSPDNQDDGKGGKADTSDKSVTDPPPGAPEAYEDYQIPEGMEYDKEYAGRFNEVARELNLTQDQAQKLVSFYAQNAKAAFDTQLNQVADWTAESLKTHGQEGVEAANRALGRVADPEFVKYLQQTGLGSHPQMIATFKNIYNMIGEDGFKDAPTAGAAKDPLQSIYSKSYDQMKKLKG